MERCLFDVLVGSTSSPQDVGDDDEDDEEEEEEEIAKDKEDDDWV
jgi:hypothetical protein